MSWVRDGCGLTHNPSVGVVDAATRLPNVSTDASDLFVSMAVQSCNVIGTLVHDGIPERSRADLQRVLHVGGASRTSHDEEE